MKKFILKLLIPTSIVLFFCLVNWMLFKYRTLNIKAPHTTHTIMSGDSHIQSGLNDNIIQNTQNISQGSEHFLYSYNVIKLLLENNPHIDEVILGVAFHSFGEFYDQSIRDSTQNNLLIAKYFQILDLNSMSDISGISMKNIRGMFRNILKTNFLKEYSFIGGYYDSEGNNLNSHSINETANQHYLTKSGDQQGYSIYQLKYLKKIVTLCKAKNIRLIFINTPINKEYYKKIPKKFITNYYAQIKQFQNVELYDFHALNYMDQCYGDGDHLNAIGAKKLSTLLNKLRSLDKKAQFEFIENLDYYSSHNM